MEYELTELFGNLNEYPCWTDDNIKIGDTISIINKDCEFEYDTKRGSFTGERFNTLMKCFICKLTIIDVDYSKVFPENLNDNGHYTLALCKVIDILEESY